MKKIVIIGAGGHGKVLAEIVKQNNNSLNLGFVDDGIEKETVVFDSITCWGTVNELITKQISVDGVVVGIGNNEIRKKIVQQLKTAGIPIESVVHPSVQIASSTVIGKGVAILQGAVISTLVHVEEGAIIDVGVVVNHEATVKSFAHLTIGTIVCNNAVIHEGIKTNPGEIIYSFTERN